MARMRGPDYGSMLRAIYEPKLQRQTAKENLKFKQDTLRATIDENLRADQRAKDALAQQLQISGTRDEQHADLMETLQARFTHQKEMPGITAGAQYKKGIGLLREGDRLDAEKWKKQKALELWKHDNMSAFQEGTLGLQKDALGLKRDVHEDQLDLSYETLDRGDDRYYEGLTSAEERAKLPYKEVPIPEWMFPIYKKAGIDVKPGDTQPQGMLPSQGSAGLGGMFNLLQGNQYYDKQLQGIAAKQSSMGVPVPPHDPTGEATGELRDTEWYGNMDESAIIDQFSGYVTKLGEQGFTPKGDPSVWNKAISSLGKHGSKHYGLQLIQELETMYKGIGKEGMWSMSPKYNKKRASTQKQLESKIRALYKAGNYTNESVETHLKEIQKSWSTDFRTIK